MPWYIKTSDVSCSSHTCYFFGLSKLRSWHDKLMVCPFCWNPLLLSYHFLWYRISACTRCRHLMAYTIQKHTKSCLCKPIFYTEYCILVASFIEFSWMLGSAKNWSLGHTTASEIRVSNPLFLKLTEEVLQRYHVIKVYLCLSRWVSNVYKILGEFFVFNMARSKKNIHILSRKINFWSNAADFKPVNSEFSLPNLSCTS